MEELDQLDAAEMQALSNAAADGASTALVIFGVIAVAFAIFMIAAIWKVFKKAGQPGWAAIVPIYNYYILTKIAEKPGWWTILFLIPYVNLVFIIWAWNRIALRFGKSSGFTVGLVLLPWIFMPILGFGSAQYKAEGSENPDILDA